MFLADGRVTVCMSRDLTSNSLSTADGAALDNLMMLTRLYVAAGGRGGQAGGEWCMWRNVGTRGWVHVGCGRGRMAVVIVACGTHGLGYVVWDVSCCVVYLGLTEDWARIS